MNRGDAVGQTVEPSFFLLYATRLRAGFQGVAKPPSGMAPLPAGLPERYIERLAAFELRFLGAAYARAARIRRVAVGRIALGEPGGGDSPAHADVYLLTHVGGIALWEAWLPAPAQPFEAGRWLGWLDPEDEDGLAARVWQVLRPLAEALGGRPDYEAFYPLSILRLLDLPLATLLDSHGEDVVRLLFLDHSWQRLKPDLVAQELSRDYCGRVGGLTLLGRRAGVDLHDAEEVRDDDSAGLPPKSALPFLIAVEQLLVERAILQHLHDRLSHRMPTSIEALLSVKQQALDGLEEYYGTITAVNRFNDAVAAGGERLLGITDLHAAVMVRLDAVGFDITARYQKRITLMQFWLTIVFGATEIGFIASGIATWHYRTEVWAVLGWTVGAALASGLLLALLLKGKVE